MIDPTPELSDYKFTLYRDDDPVLLRMSTDTPEDFFRGQPHFIERMFGFMRECGGIGLAAPQIGINYRFFIMEIDGKRYTCINPRIMETSHDKEPYREGCLSYPGLYISVDRPETVYVEYTNENGILVRTELAGMAARCFQHELDHLDGVVFKAHAGPAKLKLALSKREKNLRKMRKQGKVKD